MPDITIPIITLGASWEPEDPEVESIMQIFHDALEKLSEHNEEAFFRADRIYEKLSEARSSYALIRSEGFTQQPLDDQRAAYNSMYACLWSAYKDRLTKLLQAIGYEAGFMFAGNDFERQAEAFKSRYPELEWLVEHIRLQKRNWQDSLRDNRNPQQHDGDLRNTNTEDLDSPLKAANMFARVCNAIEGIGISAISYKLPVYWNIVPLNNGATVFSRTPRFEVKHSIQLAQNSDTAS